MSPAPESSELEAGNHVFRKKGSHQKIKEDNHRDCYRNALDRFHQVAKSPRALQP